MRSPTHTHRDAFTLVELLVTISIIAILIGLLVPALGGAREQARSVACGVNLNQLGVAITAYLGDHRDALPQVRVDEAGNIVEAPHGANIGSLFGGRKGTLPYAGIDQIGADRRPLNEYLGDYDEDSEVEAFLDPSDEGTTAPFLDFFPGIDKRATMYELVGTSYNLNDHAVDDDPFSEPYPTLIPREGGRMPDIVTPSKTWVLGDQPIYNFDDGGDRGQRWHNDRVLANLLFFDLHVGLGLTVEEGLVQTTRDYTHLPSPDWLDRFQPTP